tara:strand:+ start:3450 stop:3821 length:372 start_codon:yes stop_codon:yes gene_type:complete
MNVNDLFKASFGQFGSVFLTGDGAILDLDGSSANRFVIAITMVEDVKFQKLQTLDGLISSLTTSTAESKIDDAFGAETNHADNDQTEITNSHIFPKGITIYGKWDHVELDEGSCICYLAPVGY